MFIGTLTLHSSLTSRVYWDTNPPVFTFFPCLLGHQPSSRHLLLVFFRTPYPPLVTFFPCLLGHPPSTRHVLPVFIGTPTLHSSLPSRVYWDTNPPVFFFFPCLLGHQPSSLPFLPVFIGTLTLQSSLTSRVYWDTNPPNLPISFQQGPITVEFTAFILFLQPNFQITLAWLKGTVKEK